MSCPVGEGVGYYCAGSPSTVPAASSGTSEYGSASGNLCKKRKRKDGLLRSDECGQVVDEWRGWATHLGMRTECSDVDAHCAPFDPEQDASQAFYDVSYSREYEVDIQTHMLNSYATLAYDNLVERSTIQKRIKESLVEPLVDKIKGEVYRRLAHTPDERQTLEQQIGVVFDVHRGIETAQKEDTALRRSVNPVKPVPRELVDAPDENGKATGPRHGDFVYDVPGKDELEAMALADPGLLDQLKAASDSWAGERPTRGSSRKVYIDFPDGTIMRDHAELGTRADRTDGSVRLAFIFYYDDLEVVNPLGHRCFPRQAQTRHALLGTCERGTGDPHGFSQPSLGHGSLDFRH